MNEIAPRHWMALCLASESELQHEWRHLAWVIRYRVEDTRREFRRLDSYRDVILQPLAFSYFNPWTSNGYSDQEVFHRALIGYPGSRYGYALPVAREIMEAPRESAPFGPGVLFFWAPGAMQPPGSDPLWARSLRILTYPGLDRWRFGAYPEDQV